METIGPNVILFVIWHRTYVWKLFDEDFCHIQIPTFPKNMFIYLDFFPLGTLLFLLWGQTVLKTQLQVKNYKLP